MPELPEVETIRRGLAKELLGRGIVRVDRRKAALRQASPEPLSGLKGRRFVRADRHAKFLFLRLDDGGTLLVHLGMTGKLHITSPDEPERPHTHLRLLLDDGRELRYSDPRRFGFLKLYPPGMIVPDTEHYGVDALSDGFTPERLGTLLAASRAPLKAFLLDQTKIAGLGNIYVAEALWRTGLSPRRLAANTPRNKIKPLYYNIRATLRDSLEHGGTSFNDYVDHIGQPGQFILQLAVFQREGEPCPRCGTAIRRIVQSNRSTFYCPKCQT